MLKNRVVFADWDQRDWKIKMFFSFLDADPRCYFIAVCEPKKHCLNKTIESE